MPTNHLTILCAVVVLSGAATAGHAQDASNLFEGRLTMESVGTHSAAQESYLDRFRFKGVAYELSDAGGVLSQAAFAKRNYRFGNTDPIVRGQSAGSGGGGAGASEATDPSAPLTQFQIQNSFTPETYDASGYANTLILQPVLPFPVAMPGLKEIFPVHIIRPTLPIISPSADPDGPAGVESGLGDLTLLDAYIHPVEGFGSIILGYTAILPTATDPQLGLREFQLGPAAGVLYKEIPKTLLGVIYEQPFSWESQAQLILVSPILVRHLPDEWYVGWGDLNWEFNTDNGDYNIPLNVRVGKVVKIGDQPINFFVQPFYTPEGLRQGPASEWGVKLNVTFLFPDMKFGSLLGHVFGDDCDSCGSSCYR